MNRYAEIRQKPCILVSVAMYSYWIAFTLWVSAAALPFRRIASKVSGFGCRFWQLLSLLIFERTAESVALRDPLGRWIASGNRTENTETAPHTAVHSPAPEYSWEEAY